MAKHRPLSVVIVNSITPDGKSVVRCLLSVDRRSLTVVRFYLLLPLELPPPIERCGLLPPPPLPKERLGRSVRLGVAVVVEDLRLLRSLETVLRLVEEFLRLVEALPRLVEAFPRFWLGRCPTDGRVPRSVLGR